MQQENDIELLERLRDDQIEAFNILFTKYYQPLCSFAFSFSKNKADAEEVVSDLFYTLWKKRNDITIRTNLKAYLYTSVKYDAVRRSSAFSQQQFEKEKSELSESPEEIMLYEELKCAYQSAFDKLPPQSHQVFKLHKIDGLKYKEVADIMGISLKTVETHMSKALGLIRKAILTYQRENID